MFMLIHNGKQYDSKAIVGAAYEHQFGEPLRNTDFSGGQASVVPKLSSLGFKVVALEVTDSTSALAQEVPESMWEGGKRMVSVNAYERSAAARAACIEAHGSRCAICDFDFGEVYGAEFLGFIHVHHRVPVSEVGARYEVDPVKDLVPLCPNCHAIVHYGNKTRSEEEVKQRIKKAKNPGPVE
ncbi:HNH endonuclease [Halomonas tibetensis]|uniref:HNH endonuclease n=1 Tax=Halomonas tibetensis TaxID=2259590 RepID=A0ABV7B976_9GAMM